MNSFLDVLGQRLLTTSVQTVLLVAVVWLICRFVRRLPASTQCGLWWLVAVQAVLGLIWSAPLELPLLPAADPVAMTINAPVLATDPVPVVAVMGDVAATATVAWSWTSLLLAMWLAGVLVMGLRTVVAWRRSRALLHTSQPSRDAKLEAALLLAAEAHGLRRAPELRISNQINSPQLIGPWHPVLLLPARGLQRMGDDELDMALTHELVHLQRHDLWLGLVPALAQHLFFFHPLIHLAIREYAVAREAAVDAAVVAGNRHCRQHYGRLLLQLGVAPRPGAGLASASPTFLSLKRRLLMLQNTSSFSRTGAGLILAIVAVVGVAPLRLVAMPAPPLPPPPPAAPVAPVPVEPLAPTAVTRSVSSYKVEAAQMPVPPAPPAAVPAPPAPPAAPPPPLSVEGVVHLSGQSTGNAYVLLQGKHNIMNGSVSDLRSAQRLDDGKGLLWLRRNGNAYVVRDSATLSRFSALYAESSRLGKEQGELGDRQGRLGERQGEIGARMGEIGERIGAIASRQAQLALASGQNTDAARNATEIARREAEKVRAEMDNPAMRAEMENLARQQAELGKQQAGLGRQQAAASAQAEREASRLIEQAIRDGLATPIKG